ncbi:MAG: hypothetical protein QNK83_02600 [Akkermansiaceae bacterium]
MDKERAKFILQSFRPDGADAGDPDFAEALALATKDRELGEWLAKERTRDAAFAAALGELPIPEDLREAIFGVLEGGDSELTDLDASFVGALVSVRAPEGLRDKILTAMEVEQKVVRPRFGQWKWVSSAVAAVIAVSLVAVFTVGGGNAIAGTTVAEVEHSIIDLLSSPLFKLDLKDDEQAALYGWLEGKNLPAPEVLPKGLQGLEGIGCKHLEIGENKTGASLICYRQEDGTVVHLVIMKKDELADKDMPQLAEADGHCDGCESSGWSATQWTDEQHAFLMLSKMNPTQLAALF